MTRQKFEQIKVAWCLIITSWDIIAILPVDWVGLPPEISTIISCGNMRFVSAFFLSINLVGALEIKPALRYGISAPLIQMTSTLLLFATLSPQSPPIVCVIKLENLPIGNRFALSDWMNMRRNRVWIDAAKLSFICEIKLRFWLLNIAE